MQLRKVDARLDRAPDAPPENHEVLDDAHRVPPQLVLATGDLLYQRAGRAAPAVGRDGLGAVQEIDEDRDQFLHAGQHPVVGPVLSTPARLPAGHYAGNVLVYPVGDAGGALHATKYNPARHATPEGARDQP